MSYYLLPRYSPGHRSPNDEAVCRSIDGFTSFLVILTGHLLKDPQATVDYHLEKLAGLTPAYANRPVTIEPTLEAVQEALEGSL